MTFRLYAPDAHEVHLASDVYGWDRPRAMLRRGQAWELVVDLPPDARIEYQFVVDGEWMPDPLEVDSIRNDLGGVNSVYTGPRYATPPAIPVPESPMRRVTLGVEGSAHRRTVVAYLPESETSDCPVLVYGDGPEYERQVQPQFQIQNLVEAGRIPPSVLVLVPPVDRIQEYWRRSQPYERYLVQDVLRAVRDRTPASHEPRGVFLGGASLGGLLALRTAQMHPEEVRGGVHSQSGAFWASPGVLAKTSILRMDEGVRIFADWGRFEGVLTVSNDRLTDALRRYQRPHSVRVTSEGHNWTAWRARFAEGVEWLLSPRVEAGGG